MEINPGGDSVDEGRGEPSSTTGPDPLGEAKGKRANQGEKIVQPHLQVLQVLNPQSPHEIFLNN